LRTTITDRLLFLTAFLYMRTPWCTFLQVS